MLFPFLTIPFHSSAQKANYYLEITDTGYTIGEFTARGYHKQPWKSFGAETPDVDAILDYFQLRPGKENVLLYVHAMWGNFPPFQKNSIKSLNAQMDGIDKVIAVIWHAKSIQYKKNWRNAIDLGIRISPVIDSIVSGTDNHFFVLCHSMGSRVLEGIVRAFPDDKPRFKTVLLAGADLNAEAFGEGLSKLPVMSDRIVVYINEKDRLLQASKMIHRRSRLGLDAKAYMTQWENIPNLEVVNITHSHSGQLPSLSNHMYFKNHRAVVRDMNCVIGDHPDERAQAIKNRVNNYIELK